MNLFDSHTHLASSKFEQDRQNVIVRAFSAGVRRMMVCGSDLTSSRAALALAQAYDGLYAAAGFHAHEASQAILTESDSWRIDEAIIQEIATLATAPRVVAIGEIGLDYHYDFSPRDMQKSVLTRHLQLANELNLPVILHNRESDEDMRHVVDAIPPKAGGVLHCFLADQQMADWALSVGLYIGVAGPISFKNLTHLAPILRTVPPERLLIETDCPYLAPHPMRGKRNEPAFVSYVAGHLARVLDMTPEDVAELTTANACHLFGVT